MIEIDITALKEKNLKNYSASCHEIGDNAGQITWNNAKNSELSFITEENKQECIDYFNEYGCWNNLKEWPINKLNGLFIQQASSCLRECEGMTSDEAEKAREAGQISSNIFEHENKTYFGLYY